MKSVTSTDESRYNSLKHNLSHPRSPFAMEKCNLERLLSTLEKEACELTFLSMCIHVCGLDIVYEILCL